ncbi:asparagine synthase-domain-containing protein [Melampsora americana]|nr:asparagine synthase-domain-containing protein [Melampsora americana]
MCGLGVILLRTPKQKSSSLSDNDNGRPLGMISECVRRAIAPRGPDVQAETRVLISERSDVFDLTLQFFGSVLHLRGSSVTVQPMKGQTGSIFLWNGEIFEGLSVDASMNDGERLFDKLERRDDSVNVPEVLKNIEGPYAFVYYDATRHQLWFGRDPLGRRSLMVAQSDIAGDPIVIASHLNGQDLLSSSEVLAENIFLVDLSTRSDSFEIVSVARQIPKPVLCRISPDDQDRITLADLSNGTLPLGMVDACKVFQETLEDAVRRRVSNISQIYRNHDTEASVSVLFSGGLDCTTLALLAHQHIPAHEFIDLINVAFENPRSLSNLSHRTEGVIHDVFAVPDRKTGESSWMELCKLAPNRAWRFVKVDVTISEYMTHKAQIIQLMKPNFTVMDLSIAAALYFAARGIGTYLIHSPDQSNKNNSSLFLEAYRSPARVFLSGLGADELLGGYSRHRAAFSSPEPPNWTSLIDELQLDLDRISARNLGRDDRIIGHHGREVRYPFLDSTVVHSLAGVPVHLKCDPDLGRGIGDKLLLRCLAQSLGLCQASKLEKRAIQFGARSAKIDGTAKGQVELVEEKAAVDLFGPFRVIQTGRPRLTRRQAENLVTRLYRTADDHIVGLSPSDLVLATLTFISTPIGRTAILAYPEHLKAAQGLCSKAHPVPTPPTSTYRIAPIPLKGMGVLAARQIKTGELIIGERPIMILPERLECLNQRTLDQVHFMIFDQMPFVNQLALSALSSNGAEHPIVSKIWNNEICLELGNTSEQNTCPYTYSAVYPTISRCNHDCAPNSRWHFDAASFTLNLCAVREIQADEQITVSYIHHLIPKAERVAKLKEKWGFECDCRACTWASLEDQAASDERRSSLGADEALFNQFFLIPSSLSVDHERAHFHELMKESGLAHEELIRRAKLSLVQLDAEGLSEERGTIMGAMANIYYHGMGDSIAASGVAKECLDVVRAVKGFESSEARRLTSYIKDVGVEGTNQSQSCL